MFLSLCNTLILCRIINGGDPKPPSLCSHFTSQNSFNKVRFLSSSSFLNQNKNASSSCLVASSIDQNSGSSSDFVVSYLMNSCGLTEKQALSASKKLNFKTTSNPDSVVTLFEAHGFTKPDISKIINKRPATLLINAHKTLKPKLDYFNTKEVSRFEVAKVLSTNPDILKRNLEKSIIPAFDFIKSIVGTDRYVFAVLQRSMNNSLNEKVMLLNMQGLRDEGVPQSNIVKYLINQPRLFMLETDKLKNIVQEVKGMGFDPSKFIFLTAIHVITAMTKSTWERKLNAYRKWGWSEDQIQNAFMLQPICMTHSETKISTTMDYLVNQMGISSLLIARCPTVLGFSLEKRIMPRCSVYQILVSKGLINKDQSHISSLLVITKESFLEKFVIKYEQQAPELLKVEELS